MMFDDVPALAFVIDTDTYAGSFERPLVAYMTGCIGECEVGEECAAVYMAEVTKEDAKRDQNLVMSVADDHGCHRPAAIYPNPDWWNDGNGGHYERAKTPPPEKHWPAYYSVAVWLYERPSDDVLKRWLERARRFANDPQACGCDRWVSRFTITGARLMAHKVEATALLDRAHFAPT